MKVVYLTEKSKQYNKMNEKNNKLIEWMKKIRSCYRRFFFKISKQEDMYSIPYETLDIKKIKRLIKKWNKILQKEDINYIALSEYLSTFTEIKNNIYAQNKVLIEGREVFSYLLIDALEYILKQTNSKIQNESVSLLANDNNEETIRLIEQLATKVKRINIVTNNIGKFKVIEKYLYDELGIMITIANNKKKSLAKSTFIINLDFPEELINKFTLYRKAILINKEGKIKIQTKSFKGININSFEIEEVEKYKEIFKNYTNFSKSVIYESIIYKENKENVMEEKIREDGAKIKNLIGTNGIIQSAEFLKIPIS